MNLRLTTLAGIGGLSNDPIISGALRMRRFYVRPPVRGYGIGKTLVDTIIAKTSALRTLTVHAGTTQAELFWDHTGFTRIEHAGIPHILQ